MGDRLHEAAEGYHKRSLGRTGAVWNEHEEPVNRTDQKVYCRSFVRAPAVDQWDM